MSPNATLGSTKPAPVVSSRLTAFVVFGSLARVSAKSFCDAVGAAAVADGSSSATHATKRSGTRRITADRCIRTVGRLRLQQLVLGAGALGADAQRGRADAVARNVDRVRAALDVRLERRRLRWVDGPGLLL